MKVPGIRSTVVVLGTIPVLAFLAIDYVPRLGLVWNAMHRDIAIGGWSVPYRLILAICVTLIAARLLSERPRKSGD